MKVHPRWGHCWCMQHARAAIVAQHELNLPPQKYVAPAPRLRRVAMECWSAAIKRGLVI